MEGSGEMIVESITEADVERKRGNPQAEHSPFCWALMNG